MGGGHGDDLREYGGHGWLGRRRARRAGWEHEVAAGPDDPTNTNPAAVHRAPAVDAGLPARDAGEGPSAPAMPHDLSVALGNAHTALAGFEGTLDELARCVSTREADAAEAEYCRITDRLAVSVIKKLAIPHRERIGPYRVFAEAHHHAFEVTPGLHEVGEGAMEGYHATPAERRRFVRWLSHYLDDVARRPAGEARRLEAARTAIGEAHAVGRLLE